MQRNLGWTRRRFKLKNELLTDDNDFLFHLHTSSCVLQFEERTQKCDVLFRSAMTWIRIARGMSSSAVLRINYSLKNSRCIRYL